MIKAAEISDYASSLELEPRLIERDYVIGWFLAGLSQTEGPSAHWTFTGGTCLRKCLFETYRFSDDLEFIVTDKRYFEPDRIAAEIGEGVDRAHERSGILFPETQFGFEYDAAIGAAAFRGWLSYEGPVSAPLTASRLNLTVTASKALSSRPIWRPISHPYSDKFALEIACHSREEIFAESILALCSRGRPEDLYDVISHFRFAETASRGTDVRRLVRLKCIAAKREYPTINTLNAVVADLISNWHEALAAQLPAVPAVDTYLSELPRFFRWFNGEFIEPSPSIFPSQDGNSISAESILRRSSKKRAFVERIRCATALRLCIEVEGSGKGARERMSVLEPYAVRTSHDHEVVLCAADTQSGECVTQNLDRIRSVRITTTSFRPRYLTETGSDPNVAFRQPHTASALRSDQQDKKAHRYTYRCTKCERDFERRTKHVLLRPHRDKTGSPCDSRLGVYVREENAD